MAYIYKIVNDINDKVYIGKTYSSIEKRWKEHCQDSKKDYHNRPLYNAMNKYGIEHFYIEEIEQCENPEEREIYWIETLGTFKNGYNATTGGDGRPYLDYDLVVATYRETNNQNEVARILKISSDSVSKILRERKVDIKTGAKVIQEKYGKMVSMFSSQGQYLKTFVSLTEAARYMVENKLTGCQISTIRTHISEVCRGKRKTAAKFIWRFANEITKL